MWRGPETLAAALLAVALLLAAACDGGPSDLPPGEIPGLGDDDSSPPPADDDDSGAPDDDDATSPPLDDDDSSPEQKVEARALWVTRWNYGSASDVEEIFSHAASGGFNVVLFQVRGTFDAYYDSSFEPWAKGLTGTLGQDPGWDPLQTAVDEGHARGIRVHAWLNTVPFWSGIDPPAESAPRHMLLEHPEWLVVDSSGQTIELNSSYVYASLGNISVREHIAAVAGDIADKYEVDGVHLDYIRYPGAEYSHDDASEAAYDGDDLGLSFGDWQREMVLDTVARVRQSVVASRPGTLITCAVWGIYEDLWGWNTSEGNPDYYQDSLAMVDRGLADAILPMIYWPLTDPPGQYTDYRTLVEFFGDSVPGEALWAGLHGDYDDFDEIAAEIDVARTAGASGHAVFAYSYVVSHDYWDDFAAGPFAEPALPP
jgi:hypothetical protein